MLKHVLCLCADFAECVVLVYSVPHERHLSNRGNLSKNDSKTNSNFFCCIFGLTLMTKIFVQSIDRDFLSLFNRRWTTSVRQLLFSTLSTCAASGVWTGNAHKRSIDNMQCCWTLFMMVIWGLIFLFQDAGLAQACNFQYGGSSPHSGLHVSCVISDLRQFWLRVQHGCQCHYR